jgi:hypothetical protein
MVRHLLDCIHVLFSKAVRSVVSGNVIITDKSLALELAALHLFIEANGESGMRSAILYSDDACENDGG